MALMNGPGSPLLEIEGLSMRFGGIEALSRVSMRVNEGEIFSIIGPNGAGKTTLFNCISGIYRGQSGSIRFQGQEILGMKPHGIARLRIARAFQNIELFRGMTVLDNLMSAREQQLRYGLFSAILYAGRCAAQERQCRDAVEDIIELLDLQKHRKSPVAALPYGIQKRVELGRGLAMHPKLLLVDEPVSGMNLEETEDMARYLLDINEEMKITVILIEHDMGVVMDLSDRLMVLNFGVRIAEGNPEEVSRNPDVVRAYLGQSPN